jgi:hypothetical protein
MYPPLPSHDGSAWLVASTRRHSLWSGRRDLSNAPTTLAPKKEPRSILAMAWSVAASRGSASASSAPPNAFPLKKN